MAAEPFLVAGSGRFCTAVMTRTGERALIKTGAEGVYCGALPELGLGIALKARDGASRAAEAVMGRLLVHLGALGAAALADSHPWVLTNRVGAEVGEIRLAAGQGF